MLLWLDPSAGPETGSPLKQFPNKASCEGFCAPRIAASTQLCVDEPSAILGMPDGFVHKNRRWLESHYSTARKAIPGKPTFDERMLCLNYKANTLCSKERGFASAPDFELCSLNSKSEFYGLRARDREEQVGGRRSSLSQYNALGMLGAEEVPSIELETKMKIWLADKGFIVNADHMQQSGKFKHKQVKKWRNVMSLQYATRDPAFLASLARDLNIHLIVALLAGNASTAFSVLARDTNEHNIPVLLLCNGPEHQLHCEQILDNHILQGMQTPGHGLHNEVLEAQVREGFPSLKPLYGSKAEGDGEQVGSESEAEAEADEPNDVDSDE